MRIGITTSVIQRGQTGIAQYLLALLRELLAQSKHDYTLFVLEEDQHLFQFASGRARIVAVPESRRAPVRDILWHQLTLPKLARQLELDALHIPSYRRMIWQRPCPLVATIHDLAPFAVPGKYDWQRTFYAKRVIPRLARRQNQIIATSENTASDIRKLLGVSPDRVKVIYNGLDHERFCPGDAAQAKARCRELFHLTEPFFLYVARLEHPGKNHKRLIEAFNHFKTTTTSNWQLVFAGSDWHGASQIHAAAADSPFARDILRLGFVPDEMLPELYRAADIFVYPSLFEGFGMPPLEAMACGCPVISSARGSLAEVLGSAAAYVEPESVEDMTLRMIVMASKEAIREKWRAAGIERARQFNWQKTAAATSQVHESAAASRN